MKRLMNVFVLAALSVLILSAGSAMATTWTEIDDPGYFKMVPNDLDKVVFKLTAEDADYRDQNSFGYYYKGHDEVELFSGPDFPVDVEWEPMSDDAFGFYISTPDNGGMTFYSDVSMNSDGYDHFKIFQNDDKEYKFRLNIEDLAQPGWDADHNDMEIIVKNVAPVPIPGAVWLLGSGLVGLVGIRRKVRS